MDCPAGSGSHGAPPEESGRVKEISLAPRRGGHVLVLAVALPHLGRSAHNTI